MPSIDVVIAIHDATRRLDRALDSVFAGAPAQVRAIVVCHGLDPAEIEHQLVSVLRDRVEVVAFADGVRSPAGPFNAGIGRSGADYVSLMGSDDYLEFGALAAWQRIAATRSCDAVIAEQVHQDGTFIASPLVRPWRSHHLDAVRDRLYYRSAPLGLLRRAYLVENDLRLTEGATSGEDIVMSTMLWSHAHCELARRAPRYVIGADAVSRTSTKPQPFHDLVGVILTVLGEPRLRELPLGQRRSLAIRIARTVLIGGVRARGSEAEWDATQIDAMRRALAFLDDFGPGYSAPLSRAERQILDAATTDPVLAARAGSTADSVVTMVLPRNLLHLCDRESNFRRFAAQVLDRGRAKPAGSASQ